MKAGRELDALVAEKVFGWTKKTGEDIPLSDRHWDGERLQEIWYLDGQRQACSNCGDVPLYSTSIAAAWQVVERLRAEGYGIEVVTEYGANGRGHNWVCKMWGPDRITHDGEFKAETAPEAICLAALKAVGVTDEPPGRAATAG